jgi:hypothetical protein
MAEQGSIWVSLPPLRPSLDSAVALGLENGGMSILLALHSADLTM